MSEADYDTDILVSKDWVEDHLDAFQANGPAFRLFEIESPESPENGFSSKYDKGRVPGAISLNRAEGLSDQNKGI
ncbi:hypothetical protein [Saliphagus infecundisoli]|uniref:Sulfurtransferase n=1 Tax=Saliphagus infecundisoli TaxID=1849069 RepID=A0ABD5QCM8_9EURY|nr:hypothetical protein [Saliphagus infecundisoli]